MKLTTCIAIIWPDKSSSGNCVEERRKREMLGGEDEEGRKRRGKEGKEDHFVKVPGPAGTLGQLFRFQLERQGI